MNTGNVGRGDSVAVFGCGGVGDAAIAGAQLAGAHDDHRRRPRRHGSSSGPRSSAPRTPSTPATRTPVEAHPRATDGNGADVCIEAVGYPDVYEQAFYARDLAGTVVQVGVPQPDMTIELPDASSSSAAAARSSRPGTATACPSRDFPMLIDLYLQGRLDLDRFVSARRSRLDDVEEAFHKMERGEVLRSVVVLSRR